MTHADRLPIDEELVRSTDSLRALARGLVHDAATADDVAQEAWLAALEGTPPAHVPLRWWLRGVARHVAFRFLRTEERRRRREALVARSEAAAPIAETAARRAETHRRLVDAVLALDEPYRGTVLLRFFEDLTPTEIAARTGEKPGTVRMRLKRGLEMLRARLDGEEQGDRRAWALALLPLLRRRVRVAATVAAGGLAVKTTTKLAVAALLLLLAVGASLPFVLPSARPVNAPQIAAAESVKTPPRHARSAVEESVPVAQPPAPQVPPDPTKATLAVVVSTWNGDPVAAARLDLVSDLAPYDAARPDSPQHESTRPIASAITNASGRASLGAIEPFQVLRLIASANGYARRVTLATAPGAGETNDLRVRLLPECRITGRVRTTNGTPVPDVVVQIRRCDARAKSGPDGRYELRGLEWGVVELHAARPGGRPMSVATLRLPLSEDFDVVLSEPAVLAGTVRDAKSGTPLAGAMIRAGISFGMQGAGSATTDAEGRYEIRSLPEGVVNQIEIEANGYFGPREPPRVNPHEAFVRCGETTRADFVLQPHPDGWTPPHTEAPTKPLKGIVVVRVLDDRGAPVAGARVGSGAAMTGNDGRCRLQNSPVGRRLRWSVDAEGFGRGDAEATVSGDGESVETTVVIEKAPVVRGIVRTEDGVPLPEGTLVQILAFSGRTDPSNGGPELIAAEARAVARDGAYAMPIPWTRNGTFRVTAWAPGRPPSHMGDQTLSGGPGPYVVDIVIPVGATVRGVVVDADTGTPIAGLSILTAAWRASGGEPTLAHGSTAVVATTDREGRFVATGLAVTDASQYGRAGRTAYLGINSQGFDPWGTTVDLSQQSDLTIRLARSRDVEGVVVGDDGAPVAGVRVEVDPNYCWTITSLDGRFVLRRVAADRTQLTVLPTASAGDVSRQLVDGVTPGRTDTHGDHERSGGDHEVHDKKRGDRGDGAGSRLGTPMRRHSGVLRTGGGCLAGRAARAGRKCA